MNTTATAVEQAPPEELIVGSLVRFQHPKHPMTSHRMVVGTIRAIDGDVATVVEDEKYTNGPKTYQQPLKYLEVIEPEEAEERATREKCPVKAGQYDDVVTDYLAEQAASRADTTIESRFCYVIDGDFEINRIEEECEHIDCGDYDTPETRRRIALGRMYALGIEIGFRLGQEKQTKEKR